jgi:hypothetical protein
MPKAAELLELSSKRGVACFLAKKSKLLVFIIFEFFRSF